MSAQAHSISSASLEICVWSNPLTEDFNITTRDSHLPSSADSASNNWLMRSTTSSTTCKLCSIKVPFSSTDASIFGRSSCSFLSLSFSFFSASIPLPSLLTFAVHYASFSAHWISFAVRYALFSVHRLSVDIYRTPSPAHGSSVTVRYAPSSAHRAPS